MESQRAGGATRRRRLTLLLTAAFAGLVALVAARFLGSYEVLEKGQLFDYSAGTQYKLRLGGWLTLYVEPDINTRHWYPDLINAYLMIGIAFAALTFGLILRRSGQDSRSRGLQLLAIMFVGFTFLVADELMGIHESIGHNLQFLRRLPLVKRPDDVVMMAYAIPAGLVVYYFRATLFAYRGARNAFLLALAGIVVYGFSDLRSWPIEDPLKVLTSLCVLVGVFVLGLNLLRDAGIGQAPSQAPASTPSADHPEPADDADRERARGVR